jgi:hypothetical protein
MAIDFPNSPATNAYFESNGKAWTFNGTSWDIVQTPANLSIADASITGAKLASGAAVTNIGYTPANIASPTFTGTVAGITKSMVGLGSVDNTADTAKPVSTAQQTALDLKSPLAGPTFTGTVTLPSTTSIGTVSSTEIGYVDGVTSAIQAQLDSKLTSTTAVTSNRNGVINSALNVWQRGTSSTGTYAFIADRWQTQTSTAQTNSRQTSGLTGFQYCARLQRNSSSTSTAPIVALQNFETVNSIRYAGKTVTFSFYARRGANFSATSNQLNFQVGTGTGVDQNASTTGYTGNAVPVISSENITTTWTRYSVSGSIASNVTELYVALYYNPTGTAGADDWFEFTGVQLEEGSVATPFEFEDYGTTMQKCKRYYHREGDSNYHYYIPLTDWTAGNFYGSFRMPVEMRTAPTLSYSSLSNLLVYASGTTASPTSMVEWVTNASSDKNQFTTQIVASSGTGGTKSGWLTNNGTSSGWIGFSAEI